MRVAFVALLLFVSFLPALSQSRSSLSCGTESIVSDLTNKQRAALDANTVFAGIVPDEEILLYLHFVTGPGTFVIQGNPNATGFRSTMISGQKNVAVTQMSASQIAEAIKFVRDDFSPFNIRISTDYNEFLAYPLSRKLISIVTTTPTHLGFANNIFGIAPFSSIGNRQPSNPSFTFASTMGNSPKDVADTISHEAAHTLGLAHQSRFTSTCGFVFEYHAPIGTGPTSFAPIMGDAFFSGISNWWSQECSHPTFGGPLHDFELISNHVTTRADDLPDDVGSLSPSGTITLPFDGVIGQGGDIDVLETTLAFNSLVSVTSQNIDLRVELLDSIGNTISTHNDADSLNVTFMAPSGPNTFRISAADNANITAEFMTGNYSVSVLAPTAAQVSISGRVVDSSGRGLKRTLVTIVEQDGSSRSAMSNTFGYYRFDDVQVGSSYVLSAQAKGLTFQNSPRVINVSDSVEGEDFRMQQ